MLPQKPSMFNACQYKFYLLLEKEVQIWQKVLQKISKMASSSINISTGIPHLQKAVLSPEIMGLAMTKIKKSLVNFIRAYKGEL